jgi:hypothetical protein
LSLRLLEAEKTALSPKKFRGGAALLLSKGSAGKSSRESLQKIRKRGKMDSLTEENEDNEGLQLGNSESLFPLLPSVKIFCLFGIVF